jgi:fructokinase
MSPPGVLSLHDNGDGLPARGQIAVVGEVLWDVFPESARLGGAPLNFAVHANRLGCRPIFISALGEDEPGDRAANEIAALGLQLDLVSRSAKYATGTAVISTDVHGQISYRIPRPAAYDDVTLTSTELQAIVALAPRWIYYGTLFASTASGMATLQQLLAALPAASRFYDVNLRLGFQSMDVVAQLIAVANVVKLNEAEAKTVGAHFGLARDLEGFCREGAARFGWHAAAVTLGERGCAVWNRGSFAVDEGQRVKVADTVGAGDAFSAALLHGLVEGWPVAEIANFANRVGALVASRPGAIPAWSMAEAVAL